MRSSIHSANLSVAERTREVTVILARGLVRLRRPAANTAAEPILATQNLSKNAPNQLASAAEQSVTVHAG